MFGGGAAPGVLDQKTFDLFSVESGVYELDDAQIVRHHHLWMDVEHGDDQAVAAA